MHLLCVHETSNYSWNQINYTDATVEQEVGLVLCSAMYKSQECERHMTILVAV